jgi:tetratricopeptide (TPR) repeat protein
MAALLALGRLEEALAACDRLIAIDPRDLDALYNRAVVLSRLRRFADALLAFDKVAFDQFHDVTLRGEREVAQILFDLDVNIAVDPQGPYRTSAPRNPGLPSSADPGQLISDIPRRWASIS